MTVHAAFGLRIKGTDHFYRVSLCGLNGKWAEYAFNERAVTCKRCQRVLRDGRKWIGLRDGQSYDFWGDCPRCGELFDLDDICADCGLCGPCCSCGGSAQQKLVKEVDAKGEE